MTGKFFRVDPKGSYLAPKGELKCGPPTTIALASIGAVPGDYLSFQTVGSFSAGSAFPNQNGLGAVFAAGNGLRASGDFGQQSPIMTPATWPKNIPTDIAEDFFIPSDAPVLVRIPEGATSVQFSVPDAMFSDNEDKDGNFGVLLGKPNHPKTLTATDEQGAQPSEPVEDWFPEAFRALNASLPALATWPTATETSVSHTHATGGSHAQPQYRGWYVASGWKPSQSHFDPSGALGRKHYGWDIFAPQSSKLVAPIGPARVDVLSNPDGYGNIAAFRFLLGGKKFTLIYGHLESVTAKSGTIVRMGDVVATAGCSGNAAKEMCGKPMKSGGRSDHVHVAAFEGELPSDKKGKPIDPASILRWTIRTPS